MEFIFLSSYSSLLESKLLDIKLTTNLSKATYVVNNHKLLTNKSSLIIDLPIDDNEFHTINNANIVSRFPIGIDRYKLEKFKENATVKTPTTNLILNKYMLNNLEDLKFVDSNNFLIGINSEINGCLTAVGYKLLN